MRIWSSCPTLSKRLCAVGRSRPARVAPPIPSDPRDPERLDRASRLHADRLADLEVLLPGGGLVDDELVVPGPGALHEGERVELRLRWIDAEAEVRRAAEDNRFPVLADEMRVSLHTADRGGDVGKLSYLLEQ